MPRLAHRVLEDAIEGRLTVNWESHVLDGLRQDLRRQHRQHVSAIAGGSLLVSGALLVATGPSVLSSAVLGAAALAGGALLLLRALWGGD
jgi:hypothetical protein